jgi:hypothetical protein
VPAAFRPAWTCADADADIEAAGRAEENEAVIEYAYFERQ